MRTHPLPASRRTASCLLCAVLCLAGTVAGCLRNPSADAATAQALSEIADQLGAMQQDNAALQSQVDSLRTVVARQDSVLRRVANLAGVSMAP